MGQRDTDLDAELARSLRDTAVERDLGRAALGADDLDVAQLQARQAERLGDRLLGAEARRQVLAGPARAAA